MTPFPKEHRKDFAALGRLDSPAKIQDFLDAIPINFEKDGLTCRSPLMSLRMNEAHCIEGAMLAAACIWMNGEKPLLLDFKTTKEDQDHIVALFRKKGYWGAVSKTNHAVLRYRDPIFRTVRELALSYFNEYFMNENGVKTMRSYSAPFTLLRYGKEWLISPDNMWQIPTDIDDSRHFGIIPGGMRLRLADQVEREAGEITEWDKDSKNRGIYRS